ncbi:MAG: hypothetical protein U5N58_07835 [Actinomycetota bacterium]|nr:hypothetical protein [Actinomycetota bacterium]
MVRPRQPQKKMATMDAPVEEGENLYGKLFALNSELINAQRELSKKNIQLDKLNQKLEQVSIQDQLTLSL